MPLAVPVDSIRKDDVGDFVWKAVGQKVFQADKVVNSKFTIKKVYIKLENKRTYINGVCAEYCMLKDSANLEEYDVVLGKYIPENLKDGETVVYKRYDYLFNKGDIVRVEIPELTKPGFYVPSTAVIQKATGETYVFLNDNGKAKLISIKITGGCEDQFRIEGDNLSPDTEIVNLKDGLNIKDGDVLNIISTH